MWIARLDKASAGIKAAKKNINLRNANDITLMAESEEELKSLLMKVKEECEKTGFKLNIEKPEIMESSPITSWQTEAGKVETVTDFIFLESKSLRTVTVAMKLKDTYFFEGKPGQTSVQFSSVIQSCPILCDSNGLQHARPPCPSSTPRAHSNSSPLGQWCHPIISSSVIPFSSCLQSFPASGSFQWVSSSHQVAKVLQFQLQHQSF